MIGCATAVILDQLMPPGSMGFQFIHSLRHLDSYLYFLILFTYWHHLMLLTRIIVVLFLFLFYRGTGPLCDIGSDVHKYIQVYFFICASMHPMQAKAVSSAVEPQFTVSQFTVLLDFLG